MNNKKSLIIIITAALIMFGGVSAFFLTRPAILFDSKSPQIELGEAFEPQSIIKSVRNGRLTDINVKGPNIIEKAGSYDYAYTIGKKTYNIKLSVKDTVPPVIKLKDELIFTDRDNITADMIATAEDLSPVSLSLDLGENNLSVIGEYEVTVIAEDEFGNKSEQKAAITIEAFDKIPPEIKGLDEMWIICGQTADFSNGVSVSDDKDEKPSLSIDSSMVDLNTCGSYEALYTAQDEYGNITRLTRKITVYEQKKERLYYPSNSGACWNCESNNMPYLIAVNRSLCCVTVYTLDSEGYYTIPVKSMICSVGKDNAYNQTPLGRFYCTWRAEWCSMSGSYPHYGRYAISIETSNARYPDGTPIYGIMFHSNCYLGYGDITTLEYDEYNKLGGPASLGCIRLTVADVKWLYENCGYWTIVVVYEDESSPGPLDKPELRPIDTSDEARRGWEPTDPDPNNPWN